jgi:hypothetical protein
MLLIGALLFSSMGCLEEILTEKMKVPDSGWKTYENKDWGYKIKYPADWKSSVIREDKKEGFSCIYFRPFVEKGEEEYIVPIKGSNDNFAVMVMEGLCEDISLEEEVIDVIIGSLEVGYGKLEILKYKNITLNRKPAIKVVFKVKERQGLVIESINEGRGYTLLYTSREYDKRVRIADGMIESFNFL